MLDMPALPLRANSDSQATLHESTETDAADLSLPTIPHLGESAQVEALLQSIARKDVDSSNANEGDWEGLKGLCKLKINEVRLLAC